MLNRTLNSFIEVSRLFGNYEFSLGLEPFKLYEAIIILEWPQSNQSDQPPKFNSAAMGVRFIDEYTLALNPYPQTDTYTILKHTVDRKDRMLLSVNFTDNVILFAKSALIGTHQGDSVQELTDEIEISQLGDGSDLYHFGYLKDAKYFMICEVLNSIKDFKIDASQYLQDFKGKGQHMTFNAQFQIGIKKQFKSRSAYQPTNRGDNLALEAITLTSKLPAFLKNEDKLFKLLEKIREYQKEIRRFSASKQALEVCIMIDDFIAKLF